MENMSQSENSSSRFSRPKLWHATFILPRTGQRLKGLVDLRKSISNRSNDEEERRGLLTGEIQPDHGIVRRARSKLLGLWLALYRFASSEMGIGVLKCTLAYFLGSLATFVPAIVALLGHGQDSTHLVATVTVYFHPARSKGSMYKALICAFLAFLYAAFISITSMCVTTFFQDTLHLLPLGHALVLIVFCGGGLGFIGWTKQRLGDPLVNVACSLASLSTITILTKEGAVQKGDLSFWKIFQVLKMVVMGVAATMAVSFLIFPISARKKLRLNLTVVTETLAVMLAIITESFLKGSEKDLLGAEFTNAAARHKAAYGQLDSLIKEAKLEHFATGTEREYRLEKKLARELQDITHNLGGLRSAAALQFQLLKQNGPNASPIRMNSPPQRWPSFYDQRPFWALVGEGTTGQAQHPSGDTGNGPARNTEAGEPSLFAEEIFSLFISHLGPSMRSLAFTLGEIFKEIPFGPAPGYKVSTNSRLSLSLHRAIDLYRESRERALTSIYRQKELLKIRSLETEADLEEVSASCGHFSFSLLEFSEELGELLAVLDELQLEAEERPNGRSWSWMKFWRNREADTNTVDDLSPEPRLANSSTGGEASHSTDPSSQPDLPHDHVSSQSKSKIGYRVWKSLRLLRRDDTKFAIKVGTGAALYALPAFLPSTRPYYSRWRGEWGLLSYMLVCSMTIGASNTTGYARFFGTCLGALCAVVAWYLTAGNAYGLAPLGLLMAASTSYLILVKKQGPMGRFIVLTYNLTVLYAYSLSQRGTSVGHFKSGVRPIITEIALHRVVAVLSGCIWGIIITRVIWPISARKRLKHSLSLLWLRMSLIWKRDPLSTMVKTGNPVAYMTTREKLEIERFLARIESFRAAASSEFGLKRAFPNESYSNLIRRTRIMVDAFHAMNLQLMTSVTASEGEISILRYTTLERQHLSARICHLLSVIASSMKLEYPIDDVLPSIDNARDRLLARIFHYRRDKDASRVTTDEDYALPYSYALVTGQLSNEIVEIMAEIGRLFGALNEDVVKLV